MTDRASGYGELVHLPDPEPRSLVRFHLMAMIVWALLAIPTVLLWRQSILWVAFMSLYANFVGHFSGWDAARAEQSARESEEGSRAEASHEHGGARPLTT